MLLRKRVAVLPTPSSSPAHGRPGRGLRSGRRVNCIAPADRPRNTRPSSSPWYERRRPAWLSGSSADSESKVRRAAAWPGGSRNSDVRLTPSRLTTASASSFTPASSQIVGAKSITTTGSRHSPGETPGARMTNGTRTPPSYIEPLPDRSGVLLVQRRSSNSPTCPPLSERKITTVRSASPFLSIRSSTRPTLWSRLSSMAAYLAF